MILGIDQGTTGTRACLVDAGGRIHAQAYAAHRQHTPRPGWVEHDLDEIWACTVDVVRATLASGERPRGIAIANQGETVALWDRRTRRPLHRALVWQDTRTQPAVDALAADPAIAARVRDATGLHLDAYFSAPKLRWLLDAVPHDGAMAGTLDAWLIDRLTGAPATDPSTAARTLLYDTRDLAWSPFLLELFGIARDLLPDVRDSDAGFGVCACPELPQLDGVPVVASVVDQPAALAGHGCLDRGDAKATFGTGCFVYVQAGPHRPTNTSTVLATVAWRRTGEAARYALDGGVLAAGAALDWLKDLGLLRDLDATLAEPRRDREVTFVPSLFGLGAPHWDRDVRAAFGSLSLAATRVDLVHAVAEGIACRVAEVVEAMEAAGQGGIAELRADGGLTRSAALMQLQADLLGIPVAVAEEDEATIAGVCALASLRLGELTDDDLRARRTRVRMRAEPRISADERAHRRARFTRAREALPR